MKQNKLKSIFAVTFASIMCLSLFAGCSSQPVERSGKWTAQSVEGAAETKYVLCVSKNYAGGAELIDTINGVIKDLNVDDLAKTYCDYTNRRTNRTLENFKDNLLDNQGAPIYVVGATFEPFNYSGAMGAYADGLDTYLMHHVAERLDRKLVILDYEYLRAYEQAKAGVSAYILMSGIALTQTVQEEFLVSDVYLTGQMKIVSDETESFTKLEQLKDKTIGVVAGRESERIVQESVANGKIKGATVMVYGTDAEAESNLLTEMCDVLVIDEMPAELIVAKANAKLNK